MEVSQFATRYSLFTTRLPQLPACRYLQRADDLPAAHPPDLCRHVDDNAAMVRHNSHDVTHIGARVAARQVEKTMLLGETRDLCLGVFKDQPVTVESAAGVRCQCFTAG